MSDRPHNPSLRHNPPLRREPVAVWYHGSPLRLSVLRPGSTVTPIIELARAFAHRPSTVGMTIVENDEAAVRKVIISHNGTQAGYLYRVVIHDAATELKQHPESGLFPGEEMLSTTELDLKFLEELPVFGSETQTIVEAL